MMYRKKKICILKSLFAFSIYITRFSLFLLTILRVSLTCTFKHLPRSSSYIAFNRAHTQSCALTSGILTSFLALFYNYIQFKSANVNLKKLTKYKKQPKLVFKKPFLSHPLISKERKKSVQHIQSSIDTKTNSD